ncbi:MAG: putative sulfate/molybdate transporter [Phycisphaerae bacterium]|jgi:MFS superfamily sulfate permease-like transporter|nr:putative sulfate/molybdate transporter [Phycisphaerae bacterium]
MSKDKLPLRFDRNEFAGAFGDVGTDIPLILLLIPACNLDARSVLILFGVCQIFSGLAYRLPIPVQPMKAMATFAIAAYGMGSPISAEVLATAALLAGAAMMLLSISGGINLIGRAVPKVVIRGLQFGLGIKLAMAAMQNYLPKEGATGYVLAAVGCVFVLVLRKNRKFPAAIAVLTLGVAYVVFMVVGYPDQVASIIESKGNGAGLEFINGPHLSPGLPIFTSPNFSLLANIMVLQLVVTQLPLSLGNAVLATSQTVSDLFPRREVKSRKLGITYGIANMIAPLFGGIPVCHGSGGLVGHYTFGGRTGGSVLIYGLFFLVLGCLFGNSFYGFIMIFPVSLLAVLLVFEGIGLMRLSADSANDPTSFFIVLLVGLVGAGVYLGFFIGLVGGTILYYCLQRAQGSDPACDDSDAGPEKSQE